MPMCSTNTWVRVRLTHMELYIMHNINIYNQSRSPPDRHPQLVLQGWRLQGWLLGGSPYSSRRQAGRRSEHTPHESENTRFSIGCKLACASICPAMPLTPSVPSRDALLNTAGLALQGRFVTPSHTRRLLRKTPVSNRTVVRTHSTVTE